MLRCFEWDTLVVGSNKHTTVTITSLQVHTNISNESCASPPGYQSIRRNAGFNKIQQLQQITKHNENTK